MDWLHVFCAGAAVAYLGEAWTHGALFAGPRAWLQAYGGWPAALAGCPFCLSYWLAVSVLTLSASAWPLEVLFLYAPAAAGLGYSIRTSAEWLFTE